MTPEINAMDPALEQAVSEIRDEPVDPAVIEAAAARVWARLSAEVPELHTSHLRTCADFQALIPEFRAGRMPEARATLVRDHLHECVACRKVYEGRVVAMPIPSARRHAPIPVRWAAAAVVVLAAGVSVYIAIDRYGGGSGHAVIQSVDGTLYAVSAGGLRPIAAGQDLPDGVELRTAKDSDAVLQLRDGSSVELRERSGLSTTRDSRDITVHLVRGSVIVQAAKRRSGHLYVATPDFRIAVTGTVFSVSAGVKGSRVSVIQGEVHVSQDNKDTVLHPGQQQVTSAVMEPVSDPRRCLLEPQSRASRPATERTEQRFAAAAPARAALREPPVGPPAGCHRILRQHSQPGTVPGRCAIGVPSETGGKPRAPLLVGRPCGYRRSR